MRKSAIDIFKRMELTGNELENIFFPDKRIVCNTCHKIRIKTFISKYDFDEGIKIIFVFARIRKIDREGITISKRTKSNSLNRMKSKRRN